MCFKKKSISWPHSNRVALLFAINDYTGSANDLSCCVADLELSSSRLGALGFQLRAFRNSEATRRQFREQLTYAFTHAVAGDYIWIDYSGHGSNVPDRNGDEPDGRDETLYLYDGNFLDDETDALCKLIPEGVTVVFFLDSCFSGTATKLMNGEVRRVRYMPPKEPIGNFKRIKRAIPPDYNRIVISACLENEPAEEGVIGDTCNGVAHHYLWSTFKIGDTWDVWFKRLRLYIPNKNFLQTPTIEIAENRLSEIAIPINS